MRTYARRYVAALVAIMIATAFIVAINALSQAAREGSNHAVEQQYRNADLAVSAMGSVDAFTAAARETENATGVTDVATNWQAYAKARFPDGTQNIAIGSIATASPLRWQQADAGRLPSKGDEVALSAAQATQHRVKPGDVITLDLPAGDKALTVTGTVKDVDGPLKATAYLPERAFGSLDDFGFPLDIVATATDTATVVAHLSREFGSGSESGGTVLTGDEHRRALQLTATRGIDVFQKLIFVFAGISLFVGALVIANTFTILLAQRARDLALLRCVGAQRAQVARSVVCEGALVGVIGSALGVALGTLIAVAGTAIIGELSPETPMSSPSLSLFAVAIPVLLGIAVTVASAWAPSRRASAQSPLGALHPQGVVEVRSRSGLLRIGTGTGFLLVGIGGLVLGVKGSLAVGMLAGMLSFIGIVLLTPLTVPFAIRLAGPIARRLGVPGQLAHMNSMRNPRRTAATSTALLIGVTLITAVVVGSASIQNKVNTSLDLNTPVDLTVSVSSGTVSSSVVKDLRDVDGVAGVATLGTVDSRLGSQPQRVLAVDRAALATMRGDGSLQKLRPDQIVLPVGSEDLLKGRDTVMLRIGDQRRELQAIFAEEIGSAPLVSASTLKAMGGTSAGIGAVWLRASDQADPADVTSDVRAIAETSDLDLAGGLPDRADILKTLDVVLAVTVGLLAIAVLIALIGVGNTLSLSVLERVRENSLLRALGLRRSGLRAMLAIEALLIAVVSAGLGVVLGTVYAWFGVKTVSVGVFMTSPDVLMPWGQIVLIMVISALAGLGACVLPARRAAKIEPAAGLVAD